MEDAEEQRARRSLKVRENKLRRMAERQGLALHKSRIRDPHARHYGAYWLHNPRLNLVVCGAPPGEWGTEPADLDAIEAFLTQD
jgi:hypothetical protein